MWSLAVYGDVSILVLIVDQLGPVGTCVYLSGLVWTGLDLPGHGRGGVHLTPTMFSLSVADCIL